MKLYFTCVEYDRVMTLDDRIFNFTSATTVKQLLQASIGYKCIGGVKEGKAVRDKDSFPAECQRLSSTTIKNTAGSCFSPCSLLVTRDNT